MLTLVLESFGQLDSFFVLELSGFVIYYPPAVTLPIPNVVECVKTMFLMVFQIWSR